MVYILIDSPVFPSMAGLPMWSNILNVVSICNLPMRLKRLAQLILLGFITLVICEQVHKS
jgi:hypothetical protein